MRTLADLLETAEREHAARIAVSTRHHSLTYKELFERARRLAHVLREQGTGAGDRVALVARNNFRCIELNIACSLLGAILVPINFRLAQSEVNAILASVGCQVVVRNGFPELHGGVPNQIVWEDAQRLYGECQYETLIRAASPVSEAAHIADSASTAQIYFTSGSTGSPKGVCLSHANLVASALDAIDVLDFGADDVWLHAAPMFHLVDAFAIWAVTAVGGRHVSAHFEPSQFGELVAREGVTKTSLPPTMLDWISRLDPAEHHDLSSLRLISYGGSPMQDAVYTRCFDGLTCRLLQAYGLTEGAGIVCHEAPGDNEDPSMVINTVGRPVPRVRLMLRAPQGKVQVGVGEVGEVLIAGERVFQRYWQDPDATAKAFDNGWYRTGDLAVSDSEGRLRIVGRAKEMIISGGENVYPAEVVNALVSHPAVAEAVVFGLPSARWGEEVQAVVYAPGPEGTVVGERALREHCKTLIAGYKTPRRIRFASEPLPCTGAGKLAVAAIREATIAGDFYDRL